jgi:uncharacterized protein
MTSNDTLIEHLDWVDIARQLDIEGYAALPGLFGGAAARELARQAVTMDSARHVRLASADLGQGDMYYFGASLPAPLEAWRPIFYRHLAAIANHWNLTLGVGHRYPEEFGDFLRLNQETGQTQGQCHVSRLGAEDYVPLHQRNDVTHVFPLQIVALLSEPGKDFHGGEFVMTEQRPRMQSRPLVLPLKLGDAAIITTARRPFKGAHGYYRVNLKHAISRVRMGERIGLELSFHQQTVRPKG